MIIIYTKAYNAENTIRRTIESILNQTYGEFRYILYDNGSVDGTMDIMREYARKDNRIVILSTEINVTSFNSVLPILRFIVNNYSEEDYFCNVDADDVYSPCFMEHMLAFAKKNKLDVVLSGYNVLERGTDRLLECKVTDGNLVMEHAKLPQYFMTYRRYMTDMWAKLFKVSLLRFYLEPDRFEALKRRNHTQQNFIYDAVLNAARVGMLAEPLLDYYVSDNSRKNMRMMGNVSLVQSRTIFEIMDEFLKHFREEEGISQRNQSYIYAVYCGYIKDVIGVLSLTNAISLTNKINYFFDIFTYYVTKDMLKMSAPDEFYSLRPAEKEKLCSSVLEYIYAQSGWEKSKEKVEMIADAMKECGIKLN